MDKIRILQGEKKDAEVLFTLYKKTVQESFNEWTQKSKDQWLSKDYSPKFWKELLENKELPVFVAYEDNKMVGYAALETIRFEVAYFSWIAVLNEKKGKGIGSLLMKTIEDWCRKERLHKIELETQVKTISSFFEKHGYVLEGVRKNSWQNLDNFMFGKDLQ